MRTLLALLLAGELAFSQTSSISLLSPNGGEVLLVGNTYYILWTSQNVPGSIRVRGTVDNGAKWFDIAREAANTGSYTWQVPDKVSSLWKVKLWQFSDPAVADESNSVFSIQTSVVEPPPVSDSTQKLVKITWNKNVEPDVNGYRVYFGRKSRTEAAYASYIVVADTTYAKYFGVGTHYFAVTAMDLAGNESDYSDEVFATIEAPIQDKTPPGKPSGVGISVQ